MLALALAAQPSARAAFAQDVSTGTMALASFLDALRRDNPELKASRQAWAAAEEAPVQAAAFEAPTVKYTHMFTDLETKAGPMMDQWTFSQKVPFWGKRGLRRRAASLQAEIARQAYRAKALEVSSRAVRAYCELCFLDRALSILKEQLGVLDASTRVAAKKYAVGRGPQAMVLRAQVESAKLDNDLVTAEQERLSARARLNALLDRPPRAPLGAPEPPAGPDFRWDVEDLRRRALAARPEVLAARDLEGRRAVERGLALRRWFPDFMLGYQYSEIGSGTTMLPYDGRDVHAVMIEFNLPLWLNKNKAAVREARADLEASRWSLEGVSNRTLYEVEDLSVQADTAARLFKLYEATVLPQARAALQSVRSAYEGDQAGFLDLLDSERTLLRFELEHERQRVDFAILLAELERVVGEGL
ncbi:MAG: TolC family protein [Elusimicrobia bacterium]|nr:TolC family protein [Elusimicrobiota bacterium]